MSLFERLASLAPPNAPGEPTRQPTADAEGLSHRISRWPLAPGHPGSLLRPSLLGGCFDHVALPQPGDLVGLLPSLGLASVASGRGVVGLDIETTGLSGSGAFVFVLGLGHLADGEACVEQWTLRDPAAEDRLLGAALDRIGALGGALVSFNGSSFDLPLLRRRARLHGLSDAALSGPHLDLLPVARRLWKGLQADCRLTTLERCYLGVERVGDVAGDLVPDAFWAAFARPDDPASERRLSEVREHNCADVISLLALIPRLARAIRRPEAAREAVRAARHLAAVGDPAAALARLAAWLPDPGPTIDPGVREAALLGAELLRRTGRRDEAATVWRWVCARFPGEPVACEALAKHLEHRCRRPQDALDVALRSRAPSPGRIARLRRKVAAL